MTLYTQKNIPKVFHDLNLKSNSCVAFIVCEDNSLIQETVDYFIDRKFSTIVLLITHPDQYLNDDRVYNVKFSYRTQKDIFSFLNTMMPALQNCWVYWGFNGEFFYYPFCETRTVADLADFMAGERRKNIFGTVVDLYSSDLSRDNDGISLEDTFIDKSIFYSREPWFEGKTVDPEEYERIRFIYGGLRWRYSEFVRSDQRRVDRIPFFQVDADLRFDKHGIANRPEFYTYKCEFHSNPTCAIMSFHMTRYILHNHNIREHVEDFVWSGSQRFRWSSAQLLRLGIIETGQWF